LVFIIVKFIGASLDVFFIARANQLMPQSYPRSYFPILLQTLLAMAAAGGMLLASLPGHRVRNKAVTAGRSWPLC
jgi:hypothetical protein